MTTYPPVPATWADGDGIDSTKLNAVSALQNWYWGSRPIFHGTSNNAYALTDGVFFPVPLCTASGTLNGIKRGFTHTDYTSDVIATVPGWYDFVFQGGFQAASNGLVGARYVGVAKNGVTGEFVGSRLGPYHESATGMVVYSGGGTVWLNGTTDYLTLYLFKATSAANDIYGAYTNVHQLSQLGIWWVGRDQT